MLLIKNIVKKFGSFTAVNGINVHIKQGELYGFLGQNGAGKTTTIKMIAGVYAPTSGSISINGIDISKDPVKAKLQIGYVPDQPYLYDKLTGREFLYFSGGLYNLDKKIRHQDAADMRLNLEVRTKNFKQERGISMQI